MYKSLGDWPWNSYSSFVNLKFKGIILESHYKPRGERVKSTDVRNFRGFIALNLLKIWRFWYPFCC